MKKLFDQAAFCVDDTLDAGSSGSVLNSLGMPVNPATTEAFKESEEFLVGPDPLELRGFRGEQIINRIPPI